jgi:acetone carboxylase, gamma subunit
MTEYDRRTLAQLLDGELTEGEVHDIISGYKDRGRFAQMIQIYQDRLGWTDRILLPYGENLFIVEKAGGERAVRCRCGHEFGDPRSNWKLEASIFVRSTQELMDELYPALMSAHPDWMELREYYCPGCQLQLEVEAVPPGYPIVFDFQPDIDVLYGDWLGTPLQPAPGAREE